MRVRFLRDFRWRPPERRARVAIMFRAGVAYVVRRVCGEAAIAAGAAEPVAGASHEGG